MWGLNSAVTMVVERVVRWVAMLVEALGYRKVPPSLEPLWASLMEWQ